MMKHDVELADASIFSHYTQWRPMRPLGGLRKRVFDVVGALILLVLFSPLFLLIAIAVKLDDRGAVLFGHQRVGHNGKAFRCLKFRTMVTESDARLAAYLAENPAALAEWATTRKLRHDIRVTTTGKVLRKLSLDELPQLLNVLRGDMSLVGPRPIMGEEMARYGDCGRHYLRSRPGLTGKWQVSGRSDTTYEERVQLDSQYVEHWSFVGDVWIILKTVPVVLFARGAR
ncbi:exopolysaccharide production protein ExoY [Rhizobium mongolense]|uniref:Exopolysaccharide production protein ExoY n=2 Tax=Rhizobium mongolense TaxID=57676 RepID=A0A7W6RMY1_9HYPH|nr:exopolysaccharide production protein ExoY [Rhizobium mongolense]